MKLQAGVLYTLQLEGLESYKTLSICTCRCRLAAVNSNILHAKRALRARFRI